jgi:hypothetical protein
MKAVTATVYRANSVDAWAPDHAFHVLRSALLKDGWVLGLGGPEYLTFNRAKLVPLSLTLRIEEVRP